MRFSYRYLLICLALVLCLQSVAAAPYAAVRRQDDGPADETPTPTAQDETSQPPSATPTPSRASSSRIESERPSSTAVSVKPAETPTASTTSIDPAASASDEPTPSGSAADDENHGPLPINPTLTPAMGISGVLLLLTGLAYAIIGIKNNWVHIFGSAAYLTALAVTVLIVYLMNPPVTNAIQGAFFVAAFFTGVIFGILSLVFSDITEGFGCLLGGFCLSMWFLSLKDGGLITSTTGRAIFIGCMAAGSYSLSFSHYTRNYGLIVSTAFSGATAAILGIDCLAGSGWKEFWLYLWDLNDDIFPLNTNTYRVTKNMKAELAGVVIIAVFGVISQMRVWKLVKEHRAKSAAQELERQQDQDREEEARGRTVEDNFQKERAQWEAAYGGKSMPESSVRSSVTSPKGSTSIREKEVFGNDSLEMVNLAKGGVMRASSNDAKKGATVTVNILKDDAIQQIDAEGNPVTPDNEAAGSEIGSYKALPAAPESATRPTLIKRNSLRPSAPPPPPAVVPLPFTVPSGVESNSGDDNASISAVPETETDVNERRPVSKRMSDVSAMRKRISRDVAASQEALIGAHGIEEDRASSVAATLDNDHEVLSIRQLSPPRSPIGTERNEFIGQHDIARKDSDSVPTEDIATSSNAKAQASSYEIDDNAVAQANERQDEQGLAKTEATPPTVVRQSLASSTNPKAEGPRKKRPCLREIPARADTLVSSSKASSGDQQSKYTRSEALSGGSRTENADSHVGSLRDGVLPERLSKVALSYRTNEWAKHLESADKPDYEDMFLPASPGIKLADGSEEAPAPVSDEIASPLLGSKRDSRRTSAGSKVQKASSYGLQRTTSTFSQEPLLGQRSPIPSPIATSPGIMSGTNSGTRLDVLTPLPSNTLMGKRESLIKNRASSQSLTPYTSAANLLAEQGEQEDMTLAQRRSLLQQQASSPGLQHQASLTSPRKAQPSTSQKWQKKGWAVKGGPAGFDSHQPQRRTSSQSEQKREQLYAGWRDSMRGATPPLTAAQIAEQQRVALLGERRQKEMEKQQRDLMQQQRASQMDSMMRSGQMLDAHREAMRKMQANANKNANKRT